MDNDLGEKKGNESGLKSNGKVEEVTKEQAEFAAQAIRIVIAKEQARSSRPKKEPYVNTEKKEKADTKKYAEQTPIFRKGLTLSKIPIKVREDNLNTVSVSSSNPSTPDLGLSPKTAEKAPVTSRVPSAASSTIILDAGAPQPVPAVQQTSSLVSPARSLEQSLDGISSSTTPVVDSTTPEAPAVAAPNVSQPDVSTAASSASGPQVIDGPLSAASITSDVLSPTVALVEKAPVTRSVPSAASATPILNASTPQPVPAIKQTSSLASPAGSLEQSLGRVSSSTTPVVDSSTQGMLSVAAPIHQPVVSVAASSASEPQVVYDVPVEFKAGVYREADPGSGLLVGVSTAVISTPNSALEDSDIDGWLEVSSEGDVYAITEQKQKESEGLTPSQTEGDTQTFASRLNTSPSRSDGGSFAATEIAKRESAPQSKSL
jgi:hypothetical protein